MTFLQGKDPQDTWVLNQKYGNPPQIIHFS